MRILIFLQTLVITLLISFNLYASDSSFPGIIPASSAPMTYKATVDSTDPTCTWVNTISFADANIGGTGPQTAQCPTGFGVSQVYNETFNSIHELVWNVAAQQKWLLVNVGVKINILCCPVQYQWCSAPGTCTSATPAP